MECIKEHGSSLLTATLKRICNDSFIDVVIVLWLYKRNWAAASWVALSQWDTGKRGITEERNTGTTE